MREMRQTNKLCFINMFSRDGSNSYVEHPLQECEDSAAFADTTQNWTGYELSDEERLEGILCPHCKQFPFKSTEIQIYDVVRIVCFREADHGAD